MPASAVRLTIRSSSVRLAGQHPGVEVVGLVPAGGHQLVEAVERAVRADVGQPQAQGRVAAGRNRQHVVHGRLGAAAVRVDLVVFPVHDGPFDAALDVGRVVGGAEHPLVVGLVPGDQHRHRLVGVKPAQADLALLGDDRAHPLHLVVDVQLRHLGAAGPGPGVPEPERRQHVQAGLVGPPVMHGDLHEDVFR